MIRALAFCLIGAVITVWGAETRANETRPAVVSAPTPDATIWDQTPALEMQRLSAFARPSDAAIPDTRLNGRLIIENAHQADYFDIQLDALGYLEATPQMTVLPALSVDILGDNGALVPVQRGAMSGAHPVWEWVVQPGQYWTSLEHPEQIRAVLPVALQERNANCIHYGLMSLMLDGDGQASEAIVQFSAETCAYLKFDLRTRVPIRFETSESPASTEVMDARLPRRSFADLADRYPGLDLSLIGSELEVSPANRSVFGMVIDGEHFASDCPTRAGAYPFCADLPLPSFSLAKSVVASIALMRLEVLHPGVRSAMIGDYVPACAGRRWDDVSFEHALDMATGNYTSSTHNVDEGLGNIWAFLSSESHSERLDMACAAHPRQTQPGRRWVYHTTDTYILGTALQAYLRQHGPDPDADFYNTLLRPIWQALKLSPLMQQTRRSRDVDAQPFTGWGLTFIADDIARIASFLHDDGQVDGEAWLDESLLAAALQQNSDDHGLRAINDTLRYRAGFWAYNAGPSLGCDRDVWIPSMSGFGGISVALIPNGHTYFIFSDGHEYAWRRAAAASNFIQPFCEVLP